MERLINLTPKTIRLVRDEEAILFVEEARVGDVVRVLPGEVVSVDGIIVSGTTSIDQAVITRESIPVDKTAGDEVYSGIINQMGAFDMRVVRESGDLRCSAWPR